VPAVSLTIPALSKAEPFGGEAAAEATEATPAATPQPVLEIEAVGITWLADSIFMHSPPFA
jgi:hypothetical protein